MLFPGRERFFVYNARGSILLSIHIGRSQQGGSILGEESRNWLKLNQAAACCIVLATDPERLNQSSRAIPAWEVTLLTKHVSSSPGSPLFAVSSQVLPVSTLFNRIYPTMHVLNNQSQAVQHLT